MQKLEHNQTADEATTDRPSRRAALARLGLGAAVVYAAPTVLHLDRSANAVILPSPCGKGKTGKGC